MKNLNVNELNDIHGGSWSIIWRSVLAGASFVLGKDVKEVWDEGWNDPYGID